MARKSMLSSIVVMVAVFLFAPPKAFSAFDPSFGNSYDDGAMGSTQLAQWLFDNGYAASLPSAQTFADTGYIGHGVADPDPFYWNAAAPVTFQVVQETSGFSNLNTLGYYTGSGAAKSLTQVFGGTDNGPSTYSISGPFGLYLGNPLNETWFTDRAENAADQTGPFAMAGGLPQGLIYELKPGKEWLVSWEDLDNSKAISDHDYNDMYVKVSVAPEPMSAVLYLLGGLALIAAVRMRRFAFAR